MRPVLGYTTLYSQRIIGLKKNIPAYEAHNISNSPRNWNFRIPIYSMTEHCGQSKSKISLHVLCRLILNYAGRTCHSSFERHANDFKHYKRTSELLIRDKKSKD